MESNKSQDALGSRLTCSTAWAGCQVAVPGILEGAASQGRNEDELSPEPQEMTEFRQWASGHGVGAENVCGSLRHMEFRNSHRQQQTPSFLKSLRLIWETHREHCNIGPIPPSPASAKAIQG